MPFDLACKGLRFNWNFIGRRRLHGLALLYFEPRLSAVVYIWNNNSSMSFVAEMGVRRLLTRAVTRLKRRSPLPVARLAVCPGQRARHVHRCLYLQPASVAPRVSPGSTQPPTLTCWSEWTNSERRGERDTRTGGIAMALGAGLLLCAADKARGTAVTVLKYMAMCTSYRYTVCLNTLV